MPRMTVAQAIVRFLASQYSERDGQQERLIAGVWAIFGHGNVHGLGQALEEFGEEVGLRTHRGQNEQAMGHAAVAYAKHKLRTSTMAVTTSIGPGATNLVTAAALATVNRLPVLLLPGDYFSSRIPDPVLQQLEHPTEHDVSVNDALRPVSRFFARPQNPQQLLSILPEAMRVLTDPAETGAVTIALPQDLQSWSWDFPESFFEKRVWRIRRAQPDPMEVAEAARILSGAKKPVIVCGGGVKYSQAWQELAEFSESFGIPVVETQAGKGALSWKYPYVTGAGGATGTFASNRALSDADVIVAVGTRLGDFITASKSAFNSEAQVIGINVSPMDAIKLQGLPVVGDARVTLQSLHKALVHWKGSSPEWKAQVTELRHQWDDYVDAATSASDSETLVQAEVLGTINKTLGGHATMINAAGSMPGELHKIWRPEDPRAYHLEYGFSCMGYEIPAGIGVKLAEPEREVVVLVGDGTYLMMNSEIVTACMEGLQLTVVLLDNHGYQSIHGLQKSVGVPSFTNELRHRDTSGRLSGDFLKVDYVKHLESMGAKTTWITSHAELREALLAARKHQGVTAIVAEVDPYKRLPEHDSWWDVPPAEVSSRPSVQEARKKYEQNVQKQQKKR